MRNPPYVKPILALFAADFSSNYLFLSNALEMGISTFIGLKSNEKFLVRHSSDAFVWS